MKIERYYSNAPWEKTVGYCRVLKVGAFVYVTGTAPITHEGATHAPGNPYEQAVRCFQIIRDQLANINIPLKHVVRTRLFVTNIDLWAEFGRAHREFFAEFPPTTTMVEVKRLIDSQMLIEVEADAICPHEL
jgi:enamine deaminase RidA (YjgF/YER057c/UK114 family)